MIKLIFILLFSLNCFAAREFDSSGSDEFLDVDTAALTAAPFTMSAWVKMSSLSGPATILQLADLSVSNNNFELAIGGTENVRFRARDGSTGAANTGVALSVGVWAHVVGIEASTTSRSAFVDGGNKDTDTTSITPTGIDRTSIGRGGDSTPSDYWDGAISSVAIWNVVLTDQEVLSLANGVSPLRLHRSALIAYWPVGGQSTEPDIIGGVNLTVNGTPLQVEGPPIPHAIKAPGN